MNAEALLVIVMRYVHVLCACIALGGIFVMRIVVPMGLKTIESPEVRHAAFLKMRRVFKMTIHPAILFFLISGTYNLIHGLPQYNRWPAVLHPLLGMHLLGALIIFGIALYVLAGKEPPATHQRWMMVNLVLLLLVVAVASTLKYMREHIPAEHAMAATADLQVPSPVVNP